MPVLGKLMKSIIKYNLTKNIEEQILLKYNHHGLMLSKSWLANLLELFESVSKYIVRGDPVDIVYLGFQQAFDNVSHQRLLSKLSIHGVRENVLLRISNW